MEVSGAKQQTPRMGFYKRMGGVVRHGRPVYKRINQREYIYYGLEYKWWLIGPDYNSPSGWVHSDSNRGGELDAHLVRAGSWKEYTTRGWQMNSAIKVVCARTGTHRDAARNL